MGTGPSQSRHRTNTVSQTLRLMPRRLSITCPLLRVWCSWTGDHQTLSDAKNSSTDTILTASGADTSLAPPVQHHRTSQHIYGGRFKDGHK